MTRPNPVRSGKSRPPVPPIPAVGNTLRQGAWVVLKSWTGDDPPEAAHGLAAGIIFAGPNQNTIAAARFSHRVSGRGRETVP
jgi:hypothetical protein